MKNEQRVLTKQAMVEPRNDGQLGGNPNLPGSITQSPSAPANNLQSFINKTGGIDGILAAIEKTQKFVETISPFLPLLGRVFKKKKKILNKRKNMQWRKRNPVKKNRRPRTAVPKG